MLFALYDSKNVSRETNDNLKVFRFDKMVEDWSVNLNISRKLFMSFVNCI